MSTSAIVSSAPKKTFFFKICSFFTACAGSVLINAFVSGIVLVCALLVPRQLFLPYQKAEKDILKVHSVKLILSDLDDRYAPFISDKALASVLSQKESLKGLSDKALLKRATEKRPILMKKIIGQSSARQWKMILLSFLISLIVLVIGYSILRLLSSEAVKGFSVSTLVFANTSVLNGLIILELLFFGGALVESVTRRWSHFSPHTSVMLTEKDDLVDESDHLNTFLDTFMDKMSQEQEQQKVWILSKIQMITQKIWQNLIRLSERMPQKEQKELLTTVVTKMESMAHKIKDNVFLKASYDEITDFVRRLQNFSFPSEGLLYSAKELTQLTYAHGEKVLDRIYIMHVVLYLFAILILYRIRHRYVNVPAKPLSQK